MFYQRMEIKCIGLSHRWHLPFKSLTFIYVPTQKFTITSNQFVCNHYIIDLTDGNLLITKVILLEVL